MNSLRSLLFLVSLALLIGCESEQSPDVVEASETEVAKAEAKATEVVKPKATEVAEVRQVTADGLPLPWHTSIGMSQNLSKT